MCEQVAWKESYYVQSGGRKDIGAKSRLSVTKCRFTRRLASLAFGVVQHEPSIPHRSHPMSRRQIALLVVAIASFAVTACGSSPTAPRNDEPAIVTVGSGG